MAELATKPAPTEEAGLAVFRSVAASFNFAEYFATEFDAVAPIPGICDLDHACTFSTYVVVLDHRPYAMSRFLSSNPRRFPSLLTCLECICLERKRSEATPSVFRICQ